MSWPSRSESLGRFSWRRVSCVPVATADFGKEHAVRVVVTQGPVIFRIGSTVGGADVVPQTTLDTGTHSIAFTPRNGFGVLDHQVTLENGAKIEVPMRVIANGEGGEVLFTLFRQPDMTSETFAGDAAWVERDLASRFDRRRCARAGCGGAEARDTRDAERRSERSGHR